MQALKPQTNERIDWEQRMLRDLAALLDCSNGEAQDIAEPAAEVINHCWARRTTPELCAAAVDKYSEAGADLSPQDALELAQGDMPDPGTRPAAAQEAIAQADAHLSNAVLPTYSALLSALREALEVADADGRAQGRLCARHMRHLISRHDRTMSGDFT